jgi:UDP-glucose:(heptosyl)LPS alpha-1,3-glucosyltransferase
VERRLVRGGRCRRFLAVSTLAREVFLQEYGLPAEQVPVIHPGIALEETSPDEREIQRRAVRQRYGIAPEETVILFVSMNFAVKGLDAVLAGTARLLRQRPEAPVRLLVVGRDRAAPYEALARRLGIERQVLFAGLVERKALGGFYAAADLYAMLSRFDTFGLVVLEAMAAGLPVLVSGNVGAKDVVDPGVNGFVVADPDDTTEVAQRLASLLDERSQAAMARAARQTARRYTWEATANSVKAVYDELLRERRP